MLQKQLTLGSFGFKKIKDIDGKPKLVEIPRIAVETKKTVRYPGCTK